ncbi:Thoeris anti-defense Tad2 family protein [Clostridium perfringens]
MSFSVALRMLKDGYKVQRKGWGDMYVTLTKDKKNFIIRNGWRVFEFADLLAEDWREYRES